MQNFPIARINAREVLRRACAQNPSREEQALLSECIQNAGYLIDYHIVERKRPMDFVQDEELRKTLEACDSVIVFTASLGELFEQEIRDNDDPEKNIFYHALAAERLEALIEAYCNKKEAQEKVTGGRITAHFPYAWPELPDTPFRQTRILGICLDPEANIPERCQLCFAEHCPLGKK